MCAADILLCCVKRAVVECGAGALNSPPSPSPPPFCGTTQGKSMKMEDVIGNGAPVGVALCAAAYAPDNAFALLILMAAVLAM